MDITIDKIRKLEYLMNVTKEDIDEQEENDWDKGYLSALQDVFSIIGLKENERVERL